MPTITIRFFHYPSHTPITELSGVDPNATLTTLRTMLEQHLAAAEARMMRVFDRWHCEMTAGGRRRVVELTAQDENATLALLGIVDYSEVLLEGPLTGDVDGVGQAVALVGAQVREQNARLEGILRPLTGCIELVTRELALMRQLQAQNADRQLRNERRALFAAAEAAHIAVAQEQERARDELLSTALSKLQHLLRFVIDRSTPLADVRLEGPHTAVKAADGHVILRSSKPLSPANHRWAVMIHEEGSYMDIRLGLLPKLPASMEVNMVGKYLPELGGWCIYRGRAVFYIEGDWHCDGKLPPFFKGDLVLFDYNFSDKKLTIRYGGKQVVGHIPKAGVELYPAISLYYSGAKVSFENYLE